MVKELAEAMGGEGWDVTVAAGYPHHPRGRLYPGYARKWVKVEQHDGFQVARGWHLINPSPGLLPRALVMVSQCAAFFLGSCKSRRPDVVVSYGPPLIGPLTSALIARNFRARLVTVIYDIYPDIAIEGGQFRNGALVRLARKMEQNIYHGSDRIVVLSEGFRRTLVDEKGVEPHKVVVVPVWLDSQDIIPLNRDNPWRREMKIPPEKFVVLYAGTVGLVSGAEVVLEAAQLLESFQDILFLFVGEGQIKDRLEVQVRERGLPNVRFLPFQPRERLSEVQSTADISLVTLAPGRGKTSVPSKVLGYMAAARPVVAAVDVDCDTADTVRKATCGLVVPPGQGQGLAEAVLYLYNNPDRRESCGQAGRQYFLQHFERQVVMEKYIDLINRLVHCGDQA
jgi:colanic acid biosynthesis glycosyl transferase WcaI